MRLLLDFFFGLLGLGGAGTGGALFVYPHLFVIHRQRQLRRCRVKIRQIERELWPELESEPPPVPRFRVRRIALVGADAVCEPPPPPDPMPLPESLYVRRFAPPAQHLRNLYDAGHNR